MKKLYFALLAVVATLMMSCKPVVSVDVIVSYKNAMQGDLSSIMGNLDPLNKVFDDAMAAVSGEAVSNHSVILKAQPDTKKAEEVAKAAGEKANAAALKITGVKAGTKDSHIFSYTMTVSALGETDKEIVTYYYTVGL